MKYSKISKHRFCKFYIFSWLANLWKKTTEVAYCPAVSAPGARRNQSKVVTEVILEVLSERDRLRGRNNHLRFLVFVVFSFGFFEIFNFWIFDFFLYRYEKNMLIHRHLAGWDRDRDNDVFFISI